MAIISTPTNDLIDFSEARCKQLIADASDGSSKDIEIKTVKMWAMGAQVAESFQVGCWIVLLYIKDFD